MYPSKADEYYPQPPPPGTAPPVATGFPVSSTNEYYTPTAPGAFETQQPQVMVPWSTGLCDCCDDVGNCCLTCICPCVTFGQVAEIVDRGSTSCGASGALYTLIFCVTGCPCLYSCFYRSKMRGQYSLQESPCSDCCVHCCCEHLALCQLHRELKIRGFDMSLGWHANMEKQGRGAMTPPGFQGGMSR